MVLTNYLLPVTYYQILLLLRRDDIEQRSVFSI